MSRDRLYPPNMNDGRGQPGSPPAPVRSADTLRIVSLNTWIGCLPRNPVRVTAIEPPGHKARRTQALLGELRELAPDVITLQECLPLPSLARQLARELDYDCLWRVGNSGLRLFGVGLPVGIGIGEGLAILAKKELRLRKVGAKRLSGAGLVTNWCAFQLGPLRWVLAGLIEKEGRRCLVVTAHVSYAFPDKESFRIGWGQMHERGVVRHHAPPKWLVRMSKDNDEIRDKELMRLADWLRRLEERYRAPLLLGADFNLDPDRPQIGDFLAATGMVNALPTHAPGLLTWDPLGNPNIAFDVDYRWPDGADKPPILQLMAWLDSIPQCPDHVLVSPGLALIDAGRAFDRPRDGVFASDHYGVWADAVLRS